MDSTSTGRSIIISVPAGRKFANVNISEIRHSVAFIQRIYNSKYFKKYINGRHYNSSLVAQNQLLLSVDGK